MVRHSHTIKTLILSNTHWLSDSNRSFYFLLLRIKTIRWWGSEYYTESRCVVSGPCGSDNCFLTLLSAHHSLTAIHQTWHPPLLQGIFTGQPAHTDWWLVCVCFYKSPATSIYLEDRALKFISTVTTGCPHRAWEPSPLPPHPHHPRSDLLPPQWSNVNIPSRIAQWQHLGNNSKNSLRLQLNHLDLHWQSRLRLLLSLAGILQWMQPFWREIRSDPSPRPGPAGRQNFTNLLSQLNTNN